MTQPLYQQWSSTSRSTTVVLFFLYYSAVLCKHHIDKREKGTPHDCVFFYEIQTIFPQLANQPSRVLPADTCMFTDHVLKKQGSMVLRKKQKKGNWRWHSFSIILIFWLFPRLLILCGSSDIVIGLHFLWNNFLCRVWNTEYILLKPPKSLAVENCLWQM